jgi:hypothetical protein
MERKMASYLTQDDVNNFGGELIDVVVRGARQAVAPELQQLREEARELQDQLAWTTKLTIDRELDVAVPNWRAINNDPRFHNWLLMPDPLSGIIRDRLLKDAAAAASAQRVINIFQGFVREQGGAGQQGGQLGQSGPRRAAQPSGQIYNRSQILDMARRRQKGLVDDATWRRWEVELCRASAEGRVRGALSLETGLPVTL